MTIVSPEPETVDLPTRSDDRTFGAVFEEHHAGLLRFAFILCFDQSLAEELVANAFAVAFPKWRLGRISDVGAYLRRIVANDIRKRARRRTLEVREAARHRVVPPSYSIENASAERNAIVTAMLKLPPQQRAAVALRFLEDRSEADTAAILRISPGSVKTHVTRGLARLHTLLDDMDGKAL